MRIAALSALLLISPPLWSGEFIVLQNGFRLYAESHERVGDTVKVQTKDGSMEFAASTVVEIEKEEVVAPPPAPPVSATPAPAAATPAATPQQLVTLAALQYGLPPEIVHSVARVESNYNPKALSPKGARGIMQLMPATARALEADPEDTKQNVEAGTKYLRELLIRYQNDPEPVRRALAAYNAGPGAVDKYKGVPPYRETQLYVEKVLDQYWKQVKKQ
jgi:soluble lytic murein transglycosylase-like protein